MASSRDPDELQYYWEQWREKSGKMIKVEYLCRKCESLIIKRGIFLQTYISVQLTFSGQLPWVHRPVQWGGQAEWFLRRLHDESRPLRVKDLHPGDGGHLAGVDWDIICLTPNEQWEANEVHFCGSCLRPLAVYCRGKMKPQMGLSITARNCSDWCNPVTVLCKFSLAPPESIPAHPS